jgi:hypothetical protein
MTVELIAKLDEDIEKWNIESKLNRSTTGKAATKRKKPVKLVDPYGKCIESSLT